MNSLNTESELRAVIDGPNTTIICFHSTRSAYSRRLVQILAEIEGELSGAEICLVDADAAVFLPLLVEFDVVGLPTIQIFCNGTQVKKLVGERSRKSLLGILAKFVKPAVKPQKS